jgi:iron complex transport system ATP-binding protein
VLLAAANLSFSYGRDGRLHAIDGVSLSVESGSIVAVLGPNGSGKTTLIKLLSGALRASHGDVMLDRVSLGQLPRATVARRIAVVPQDTHLAFDYTALEIVLMGRYPRLGAFEIEGPDDIRCALDALESTGTRELAARPFTQLSGGERQRVIIASALAQLDERFTNNTSGIEIQPILFMDEPTASLDLRYQLELATLLRRLNRERGITIVLSTHDLRLASSICTTVVMLANGRILATGTPEEVLTANLIGKLYGVDEHLVGRALA